MEFKKDLVAGGGFIKEFLTVMNQRPSGYKSVLKCAIIQNVTTTTYHPSYLLRNPSAKKEVFEDLLKVKDLMESYM